MHIRAHVDRYFGSRRSHLQMQPGYTMPLSKLHAQLVHELGAEAAGSYGQIYQQLSKRADSFLLVDSRRLLGGTDGWPRLVREAYDHALGDAGYGSCVRVTLTETPCPEAADLISALQLSMAILVERSGADESLRDFVERGSQEITELTHILMSAAADHPTTPLPDPPPGA